MSASCHDSHLDRNTFWDFPPRIYYLSDPECKVCVIDGINKYEGPAFSIFDEKINDLVVAQFNTRSI